MFSIYYVYLVKNAVQNMLNIVDSVFDTGKRPNIFCREVKS